MFARLVRALPLAFALSTSACDRSAPGMGEAQAALPPSPAPSVASEPARSSLLPRGFPRDIPIPEGLVAKSVQSEHAGSYVAIFTGELEPDAVYRAFAERLEAEGWTLDKTRGAGPEYGLFAQKDRRIATVIATRLDGKLHIELGVSGDVR